MNCVDLQTIFNSVLEFSLGKYSHWVFVENCTHAFFYIQAENFCWQPQLMLRKSNVSRAKCTNNSHVLTFMPWGWKKGGREKWDFAFQFLVRRKKMKRNFGEVKKFHFVCNNSENLEKNKREKLALFPEFLHDLHWISV